MHKMLKYIVGPLTLMLLYRFVFFDLINGLIMTPKLDGVANKRVLVTGASAGIGKQIALHYCKLGANLIVTARSKDSLMKLKQKCADKYSNKNVQYVIADMNVLSDVKRVSEFTLKQFDGKLDHLILNHITPSVIDLFDGDMEKVRMYTQVNFLSYVDLTSQLFPALKARNGSLVVISSVAALIPQPFTAVYSGTKHALEGFFGGLRGELKETETPVSISMVNYGLIGTENYYNLFKDKLRDVTAQSSEEASIKAVQIAESKERNVFYPWWGRPFTTLHVFIPEMLDWLIVKFFAVERIRKESKSTLMN